jgi:predicted aspartyl protease
MLEQLPDREEQSPKVFAKVRPAAAGHSAFYALLDTGAAWTILHHELSRSLGLLNAEGIEAPPLNTWMGVQRGRLVKCSLVLCADQGADLNIDATVFASEDWQGLNILGYQGLLSSLRFAIDPTQNSGRWFFGELT